MKLKVNITASLVSAILLTGCGGIDSASYMISGAQHSLSLSRTKTFLWDKEWELTLVTARNPECMRRHKLQAAAGADFKVQLYRSLEGNYIIRQGNNWYVTETQKCRLQQFSTPPPEPGILLGVFEDKNDGMEFSAAPATGSIPPTPALTAPGQEAPSAAPPLTR